MQAAVASISPEVGAQRLQDRLTALVGRLEAEAKDRVEKRRAAEERWQEAARQYHGLYDEKTARQLEKNRGRSSLFTNVTRTKTDAWSARLMDLLFPTDDRNWSIGPTPVPELAASATEAADAARKLQEDLEEQQKALEASQAQQQGVDPAQAAEILALEKAAKVAQDAADALNATMEEARKRAELMASEIDDQLKQCAYQATMRDVIDDACKFGTGVAKGPISGDRARKGWQEVQRVDEITGQATTDYQLAMSEGGQPAMRWVDLWSFFPDPDTRSVADGESVFERHLMNKKKLRGLAKLPGFDKDAIRTLLKDEARETTPSYMSNLRDIRGDNTSLKGLYHVWEYSGSLDAEDIRTIAEAMGDADTLVEMEEVDPLQDLQAVVWFCQGQLLKFAIYPYDSGEPMYSVFNLIKDEHSVFGYGMPEIMSDPQRALNAAWRAMMDNAALSSGPQIVIAKGQVTPADNNYQLAPRKIWYAEEGMPQDRRAFEIFNVPSNQAELANIIALARDLIDEITQMPDIAQGEQGAGVTKTAQGMAILMNAASTVFRRVVKNFDDDMTTPNIRRFYDWNMQFNPKAAIKGDYNVDARGSSVLLVREMQATNLMGIAMAFGGHPIYGPMLKNRDLLKKVFQAHMIPADEILLSDQEIDAAIAKAEAMANGAPESDPAAEIKMRELALKERELELRAEEAEDRIQLANMEADYRIRVAQIQRDTQMMELAEKMNMNDDTLAAKLGIERMKIDSSERKLATEAAFGATGGGAI
ncbi:MAG: hypothetical protein AAF264_00230 [Pseudomonadota bacterium]